MKSILLCLALALTGCGTVQKEVQIVTETQYVVRKATDQQKAIPEYPPNIDLSTATDVEVSNWILSNEERQYNLESIIKQLINFYEAPVNEGSK